MLHKIAHRVFALSVPSLAAAQTTWHVDSNATPPGNGSAAQPYADLQFALSRPLTLSGDTILVEPGKYVGGFDFLGKNLTVRSTQGPSVTILDGNDQLQSVVSFVNGEGPSAVLDGFAVKRGPGVLSVVAPVFPLASNPQREGGGVRCVNASPTLTNLTIESNRERFRNAIYFHCGKLDLYPETLRATHTVS